MIVVTQLTCASMTTNSAQHTPAATLLAQGTMGLTYKRLYWTKPIRPISKKPLLKSPTTVHSWTRYERISH